MTPLFITLLGIFTSQVTSANTWYDRGNGGFILSCPSQPFKVLDIHEAETRYFFSVVPSSKTDTIDKVRDYIDRIGAIDPDRASLYYDWLGNFYSDSQYLLDTEFLETPDLGLVKKPKNCNLEQVVFQREKSRLTPARYTINKSLWEKLDSDNRAALILHELIYRDFLRGTALESTSERIRLFNALILGNKLKDLTLEGYIELLQNDLHLSQYRYNGITLYLGATDGIGKWTPAPIFFYNENSIATGRFSTNQVISHKGFSYNCSRDNDKPDAGAVTFYPNGSLKRVRLKEVKELNPLCPPPSAISSHKDGTVIVYGNIMYFNEQGQIQYVEGSTANSAQTLIEYAGLTFVRYVTLGGVLPPGSTSFIFDDDGYLKEIGLGGTPCLKADLKMVLFQSSLKTIRDTVELSPSGDILSELDACPYP